MEDAITRLVDVVFEKASDASANLIEFQFIPQMSTKREKLGHELGLEEAGELTITLDGSAFSTCPGNLKKPVRNVLFAMAEISPWKTGVQEGTLTDSHGGEWKLSTSSAQRSWSIMRVEQEIDPGKPEN